MKILQMRAYSDPEVIASTHLTHDLDEAFAARGIESIVYTPVPTRGVSAEVRKEYCGKEKRTEVLYDGAMTVHRFSLMPEKKNPIVRAFRYFLSCRKCLRLGKKEEGIDLVYCESTPPTLGKSCAKLAKKLSRRYGKHVPFVYNLQDIFPDSLVNAGMAKKGGLLWKIGRRVEDATYTGADKIIVISDGFKRNIMEKGVPEDKIAVVPIWVDSEEVLPIARQDNILFDRYGLDRDRFYVCYSGNVGHSQNLELLLAVAERAKKELPQVSFAIFGDGAAKPSFEAAAKAQRLDNILFFPYQPYEEISHVFSFGDVGLIVSKPGIGGSSVPSKTFGIMSAARPVLASFDADSELSALVGKVGCGTAVPAGDADALIAAIRELYEKRDTLPAVGARGREYVTTELNKDKCTAMYVETIWAVSPEKSDTSR